MKENVIFRFDFGNVETTSGAVAIKQHLSEKNSNAQNITVNIIPKTTIILSRFI